MTAGLVMLAGGGTMIIVGVAKFTNELTFDFRDGYNGGEGGAVLSLVGLGSMLCSVPLFIASARNKRKASKLSTGLTLQRTIVPTGTGFVSHAMPALSLQFHF